MFIKVLLAYGIAFISFLIIDTSCYSFPAYCIQSDTVNAILVEGKVLDAESRKPLKARISYERIPTRDDIGILFSDSITGDYHLSFKDSSKYKITIQADNYITSYKIIDFPVTDTTSLFKDVLLVPLKVGQVFVMDKIVFDKGRDQILSESFQELDHLYKMLMEHPEMVIRLEGHTDNSGSSSANLKLSEQRVDAVRTYLVEKGIKKNRIEVKAFGGAKPIANNSTEEGRKTNRRVEIRIIKN